MMIFSTKRLLQRLTYKLPIVSYILMNFTTKCDGLNEKNKTHIIDKINKINDSRVLAKIEKSIDRHIEFEHIASSNINGNFKTYFCHRNYVSYDDLKCMTLDELNKKEYYSECKNPIDKVIYNSRYVEMNSHSSFDKIRPYNYDRHYYHIADAIMFNKNYNIERVEDVIYYLQLCKYYYDKSNDSYCVDGWNIKFNDYYDKLNYEINYDVDKNMKNSKFPSSYEIRKLLRAIIVIMNETPIEHLNMNNYVMLGMFDQSHDLFLQNYERMIEYEKEETNKKLNKIKMDYLQIKINKLITKDEICEIIFSNICKYPSEDNDTLKKNILQMLDDITIPKLINRLYDKTPQYGLGFLNSKRILNENDLEDIKNSNYYVSYLNGVPFKTHFSTFPIIDFRQYEKYHGDCFIKKINEIKNELNKTK